MTAPPIVQRTNYGANAVPRWRELHPERPPKTQEEADRLSDGAAYIASRGGESLPELRRWLDAGKGQLWIRNIGVHGAVANGHAMVVKILLDEAGADVNLSDKKTGYSPLHQAAVWGRPGIAVLLLSRRANPHSLTLKGETALQVAVDRLEKLMEVGDSYDDIASMRREGAELVSLLQGIETVGGYEAWAMYQTQNKFVQRHSPRLIVASSRLSLVYLRELVHQNRATIPEDRHVPESEVKEPTTPIVPVPKEEKSPCVFEAMKAAGLGDRLLMRQMERFLKVQTIAELARVTRDDVALLDDLDAKERRALWQFVASHQPKKKVVPVIKKGKKKKGDGRSSQAAKVIKHSPQWGLRTALCFLFRLPLPDTSFTIVARFLYSTSPKI